MLKPVPKLRLVAALIPLLCLFLALSCSVRLEDEQPQKRAPEQPVIEKPPAEPREPEGPVTLMPQPTGPSILRAEGTAIVDGDGKPAILKGCNFGNWLLLEMWMLDMEELSCQHEFEQVLAQRFGLQEKDRLMELYRENWIRERDFDMVRKFGFNTIRLPFNYTLLEDDERPFQLKPEAFKWLDYAIEQAAARKLYVILDMHGVPGGQSVDHTTGREGQNKLYGDPQFRKRTAWLWQRIAERYRDSTTVAAYDVINEPFGDMKTPAHQPALVEIMDLIYRGIRQVDTNHLILIAGTFEGIRFYGSPAERGWENVGFTEHFYPGLFGSENSVHTHSLFINRRLPWQESYLKKINAPFLVGEFNVVFESVGGPALMRLYYDEYGGRGWAATMWCYKLAQRYGGLGPDTWVMVKNSEDPPHVNIRTAALSDIEDYFRWLGTMEYATHTRLGAALNMRTPPPVQLPEYLRLPVEPPAEDDLPGWTANDIGDAIPGGQKLIDLETGALEVYGAGDDIWSDKDAFRYIWKKANGDFEIAVTLDSLVHSHEYAKAGIMVRSSMAPDSPHLLMNAFPEGSTAFAWRAEKGGATDQKILNPILFPISMRLRRKGDMYEIAFAEQGGQWQITRARATDSLRGQVMVGLAVLSHDNYGLTTAAFRDLQFRSRP